MASNPRIEKQSKSIKRGGARSNAGRKAGVRNKKTVEVLKAVETTGETPLQYMLRVMRTSNDERRKDTMAISAAPYIHAKLSNLNHSGEINLKAWTDEQLAAARVIFGAIAADKPQGD